MKNFLVSALSLLFFSTFVSSVRIPNADTPLFYLVSSSPSASSNLLPLRMTPGGGGGFSSLNGNGAIAKFYFWQGALTVLDPAGSSFTYRPFINSIQGASGCGSDGELGFVQGTSTNKCTKYSSFQLQSNSENSQLGARLVFNYVGGFYACSGNQVKYFLNPASAGGCTHIELYTVPVV